MLSRFVIFFIIFSKLSLFACAGGYWDETEKEFVFLHERNFPFSNIVEDLDSSSIYNNLIYKYEEKAKERNIKEWSIQLNNNFDDKDIYELIYKRKDIQRIKNKEIKEYINFVKEQEIHVTNHYYSKKDKEEAKKVNELINIAQNKIKKIDSDWLKQRYFYLAFRLAHYKRLPETLMIYEKNKHLLKSKNNSIVKDWIQGLYAGALIKNNQIEKGVYEFTKLFEKDKINWHLAYYNFHHIKTDKQWNKLLSLAKNKNEKIKFYTLRALNKNANIVEELENIKNIDINSKWLDILLFRKLLYSQHYFDKYNNFEFSYSNSFIEYLKNIKKENMYIINLSLAYYHLYINDFKKTLFYSNKALESKESKQNEHEVNTLKYITYLNSIDTIDYQIENKIYQEMNKLLNKSCSNNDIHNYTFVKLIDIYKRNKKNFKSYLSSQINYLSSEDLTLSNYEKLITFLSSEKNSKLEEYIAKRIKLKIKKDNKELNSVHTKLLINNLKFKEAKNKNTKLLNQKILYNPFNGNIKGNNRNGKKNTYTVLEFLEKTLEIKQKLKNDPNSVMDNYLYANALYNLSYFGNSNALTTVYRSNYSFKNKVLEKMKINLSSKHYKIALKNAEKKEFKAKITYLLAKNELALFDLNNSKEINYKTYSYYEYKIYNYDRNTTWRNNSIDIYKNYVKNGYGIYFDKLKKNYDNTNYYKDLIKECGNLKIYQNLKNQ